MHSNTSLLVRKTKKIIVLISEPVEYNQNPTQAGDSRATPG